MKDSSRIRFGIYRLDMTHASLAPCRFAGGEKANIGRPSRLRLMYSRFLGSSGILTARSVVIFSCVALYSCSKSPSPAKPERVQAPTPTPTAVVHRLAPAGIFFATEYMSVRSPGGITGIPPGTRLELVQDMGEVVRVTTGQVQFDAKIFQLTNDLDVAAEVSSRDAAQQNQIAAASSQGSTAISVMRATYGYGDKLVDVTSEIQNRVQRGQMSIRAGNDLAGDPAFGKVKTLTIQYSIGGAPPITVAAREGESISLSQVRQSRQATTQKQEVSKRHVQSIAPEWKSPLDSWPAGTNPLERGAYNRTQDKTYTDSSGRTYWLDIRGHRHYDQN